MMRWLALAGFALALVLAGPQEATAKFRALLVGIDYHDADPLIPRLGGAVNDARDMHRVMVETLGIPAADIQMLTERQATREAILREFRDWLVAGTAPGDSVFVLIAGHGTLVPDRTASQITDPVKQSDAAAQALSEAMLPFDATVDAGRRSITNVITDDAFNRMLGQLKGRKVTLLLDLCHSGGVTREVLETGAARRAFIPPWDRGLGQIAAEARPDAGADWHPDYAVLAATRYFQAAYEYPMHAGRNGAVTHAVLELARASPRGRFTNAQVTSYVRSFVNQQAGIPASLQEPNFHGPAGSEAQPFVLFEQASPDATPSPPPSPEPLPGPPSARSTIRVEGERGALADAIRSSIDASAHWRTGELNTEAVVHIRRDTVDLANAVGHRVRTVARDAGAVGGVMKGLEAMRVVRELAVLDNPAAASAVELWIDRPGKTRFRTTDRVTVYYRINGALFGTRAYLTLVNMSPAGDIAILYPPDQDKRDTGRAERLHASAAVETGRIHAIPKTAEALQPGRNVGVDLRLKLEEGEEFFKAIVTTEPLAWGSLSLSEFHARFGNGTATSATVPITGWAAATLRVDVTR